MDSFQIPANPPSHRNRLRRRSLRAKRRARLLVLERERERERQDRFCNPSRGDVLSPAQMRTAVRFPETRALLGMVPIRVPKREIGKGKSDRTGLVARFELDGNLDDEGGGIVSEEWEGEEDADDESEGSESESDEEVE